MSITKDEKEKLETVIREVYESMRLRCIKKNATFIEFSSCMYSLQDYLGSIDCNERGISF